jgi:O-antigen/teichoic acid export membrane protein
VSKGFHNPELNGLIKIYIWFFFFLTPIQFINQLLVVLDKTKQLAIYRNVFAGLRLVSVIIPVLLKADLTIIIVSLVFFSFIQFVYTTLIIFKPYSSVKIKWNKSFLHTQVTYSIYLGLASIIDTITRQLDQLIVSFFFISGTFAIYANGARELPFIGLITGSIMAVLTPAFVRLYKEKKNKEILRIWHESARKIALILFPITAFLILFAKELMVILFSSKYASSAIIFQIYLLTTPMRIVTYGSMLMAINKTKLIFRGSILALIIDTALNFLFIKLFGITGPAISTVLVLYFLAGYHLRNIKKGLNIKYSQVMPWKKIFKLILISILPLIIILPIKLITMPILTKFIIAGIIYSIAFLMLILSLKEVTVKEIKGNIQKVLH